MTQLKDKSAKRREQILEAALKCFNKKGYYRTSIDEIALKTGLTKGAVYYYFKSKQRLFIELFNFKINPYFEMLTRQSAGTGNAADQIWNTILQQADRDFEKNLELHKLALEFLYVSTREKDVRREASNFYKKKTVFFTDAVAAGIRAGAFRDLDPATAAWNLNFLSIGFFLLYFATDGHFNPLEQHAANMKIFFEGINRSG